MSQENLTHRTWRSRVKRIASLGGAIALVGALFVPLHSEPAAATPPTTFSWTFPIDFVYWDVPAGVDFVHVTVKGGSGGNNDGGPGGVVTGIIDVSAIPTLRLHIAGEGGDGYYGGGSNSWGNAGSGYKYGGRGGSGSVSPVIPSASQGGGGGGGSSAILAGGSPLIVAGGGGGGGGDAVCEGNPGGAAGQSGWKVSGLICASQGGDPGSAGVTNIGEDGRQGSNAGSSSGQGGGGGGGGGYRGGGGGDASTDGGGGGGGGTNYCSNSGVQNCSIGGDNWGDGSIVLRPIHTPIVTFDEATYSGSIGTSITFSGSVATEAASGGVPEGFIALSVENGASESHTLEILPLNQQGKFSYTCTIPCGAGLTDITQVRASYESANLMSWQDADGVAPLGFINAETQTQLYIDPALAVTGQMRDFTATIQVLPPATGTPTGDVEFWMSNADDSDPELIGTAPLAPNHQTTISASVPEAQMKRFWAVYLGGAGFNGSQSPKQSHQTNPAVTNTLASTTPHPTVTGEPFDVNAEVFVLSPGGGTPTGDIEVIGEHETYTLTLDQFGEATLPLPGYDAGEYEFIVHYLGDGNFLTSQTTIAHAVDRAAVDLDLAVDSATTEYGEEVTLSASAAVVHPGQGEIVGEVQFGYLDELGDFVPLADPLALVEEFAQLKASSLDVGEYEFQAVYFETNNFLAAASPLVEHEVLQATPAVALAFDPETTTYGLPQSAHISVIGPDYADADPLPASGEVQLIAVHEDGTETPFKDTVLLDEFGEATVDLEWLDPGTYSVYAVYNGSHNHLAGESAAAEFNVNQALPSIALSGEKRVTAGQELTFTVDIAAYADSLENADPVPGETPPSEAPGSGIAGGNVSAGASGPSSGAAGQERIWLDFVPTGEISLLVDGEVIAENVALAAAADGTMVATAEVTHTFTEPGNYSVAAEYGGDNYVLSGSSNSVDVQVASVIVPPEPFVEPIREVSSTVRAPRANTPPAKLEHQTELIHHPRYGSSGRMFAQRGGLSRTGSDGVGGMLGAAALLTLAGASLLAQKRSRKNSESAL